ncbi:hypothetical protein [Shewanella algae]|uniref:hypothetical protein n=1 Tax=Shewanella algae TaxID=38313 RepID=UPI0030045609
MEYAVLEPSVISISPDEWACEKKRDCYLEHFQTIINIINTIPNLSIAWSFETDELIWSSPQSPPWQQDRVWANTMTPIIFHALQSKSSYLELNNVQSECEITPPFNFVREDLSENFELLLQTLNNNSSKILIPLGLKNLPLKPRIFNLKNSKLTPSPTQIGCVTDFLDQIVVEDLFWPSNDQEGQKLKDGISIILRRNYNLEKSTVNFEFSSPFLKKLSNTTIQKLRIMEIIARRLSMTVAEAGRDPVLQDEKIEGKVNPERRFRVTPRPSSKRIHYKFESNIIVFIMFYDVGEHDDGL